jgi:hypothetical protein
MPPPPPVADSSRRNLLSALQGPSHKTTEVFVICQYVHMSSVCVSRPSWKTIIRTGSFYFQLILILIYFVDSLPPPPLPSSLHPSIDVNTGALTIAPPPSWTL